MKHLYIILFLIAFQSIYAQVLWSDDFDNHPVGLLSTDPTGVTPGYGGWHVKTTFGQIQIVPETGRGNILAIGWLTSTSGTTHETATKKILDVLWNTRNKSNNIFKLEFDTQARYTPNAVSDFIYRVSVGLKNTNYLDQFTCMINKNNSNIILGSLSGSNLVVYSNNWIKVEIFMDYNTNTIHYYIPNYSYRIEKFNNIEQPDQIIVDGYFYGSPHNTTQISIKMDNIKISAIETLPSYLNVDEFLASKFNLFPNPANTIVTIKNNENIGIEQIKIYDLSGKNLKTQEYNNENEIQLNISDLAAGTYMFHIKTNQGTAVKKVVKK